MSHEFNSNTYNPIDYYLLVFRDSGKVYEYFRNKWSAVQFLKKHPLEEELEVIINPKYKK